MPRQPAPILCVLFLAALSAAPQTEETRPLQLLDTEGRVHALPLTGSATRATVLFFTSVECPLANRYADRVKSLHQLYRDRGTSCYALYSHALETPAEVRRHAAETQYGFPALLDPEQLAAERFGVKHTPTVVILDAAGKVRYRGAVDDHKSLELVKRQHARLALDELLAGKQVSLDATPTTGCLIQRRRPENRNAEVTYAAQIGKLLHAQCADCHRPGQVAPFSLLTYEQARRWADNIKHVTASHAMPPWKPVNQGMFLGERHLSAEEIELLAKWADAGAPLGDPARVPPPPAFNDGWQLGKPDLELVMPEFEVAASGPDEYRCFVLDPRLAEDRYVQAVEFRPGNARIVHHIMTYIDAFGFAAGRASDDGRPGFPSRGTGPGFFPAGDLGGWGPGMQPYPLPDGTARLLPRGSKIVMEVHYHKSGKPERDQTRIGLHFAKSPVKKQVHSQVVLNLTFRIPPGAKRHEVKADWRVPFDQHALAIIPHMHLIGKEIVVTARYPDDFEKTLVHIKDWDFNWQEAYRFKEPVPLPRGTRITVRGWFDNSADNPNNPNHPPREVRFGENTTDEMCVAYLTYTRDAD